MSELKSNRIMRHTRDVQMLEHDLRDILADQYGLYWMDLKQGDQSQMVIEAQSYLQDGAEWNDAVRDAVRDWHSK